jgi:hypothetical protein
MRRADAIGEAGVGSERRERGFFTQSRKAHRVSGFFWWFSVGSAARRERRISVWGSSREDAKTRRREEGGGTRTVGFCVFFRFLRQVSACFSRRVFEPRPVVDGVGGSGFGDEGLQPLRGWDARSGIPGVRFATPGYRLQRLRRSAYKAGYEAAPRLGEVSWGGGAPGFRSAPPWVLAVRRVAARAGAGCMSGGMRPQWHNR